MMQRPRPRLGIRLKLMLVASILLVLPALGSIYVREMRRFVLEGQESAQLLAARAVATVLHGRDDLFDPTFGLPLPLQDEHRLTGHRLPSPIMLDGDAADWGDIAEAAQVFGGDYVLQTPGAYSADNLGLRLVLGVRDEYLYVFAAVSDDRVLYRDPRYLRLDHSDQLRLYVQDSGGRLVRYVILAPGPETGTAYAVQDDWKQPVGAGAPEYAVRSEWREARGGYTVELRLPRNLLGDGTRLAFVVADVDDPDRRTVATLLGTVPVPRVETLNRLFVRSPEIERILAGLDRPGTRIWVVDRQQRVRAVQGRVDAGTGAVLLETRGPRDTVFGPIRRLLARVPVDSGAAYADATRVRNDLVAAALDGHERVGRMVGDREVSALAAAYPIWSGDAPVGAVVVEQSESEVLALQRRAMENLVATTLVVFAAVMLLLLVFATRLTLRIRRLRNSAEAAIDRHGRVRLERLTTGINTRDEVGDLARAFSAMLQRLAQYTRYLELVPRALKHEMQNPLNNVNTSLENLAACVQDEDGRRYLAAAERGVRRLGATMISLTEAANLEDGLRREPLRELDLSALVGRYVENLAAVHAGRAFRRTTPPTSVPVVASDLLIEQLLDKLIDNAVDFSPADSTIAIGLTSTKREARLAVANDGPPLPEELRGQLFESLVSGREPGRDDRPHLGMGLYVVRVIAEHHGGRVEAINRPEGGVQCAVYFPLSRPLGVAATTATHTQRSRHEWLAEAKPRSAN